MDGSVNHEVPRDLGLIFNSVAEDYDAVRPGYPAPLFDDLTELAGLRAGSKVLEIGPGSGLATRSLLERGWRVVATEPGVDLAAIARRRAEGKPLRVEQTTFEDWDPAGERFDLVFSATAIHWIDPAVKWSKTASVLRDGGHLALMTNRTVAGNTFHELYRLSADLHRRYVGALSEEGPSPSAEELLGTIEDAGPDIGVIWGSSDPKGGGAPAGAFYGPATVRTQLWEQAYSAREAVTLLSTYSLYLSIPEEQRRRLFAGIEDLVNQRLGGSVVRRYLSILAVARRADQPGAT